MIAFYVLGPLLMQIGIVLVLAIGASVIARKTAPLSGKRTTLVIWMLAALAIFALILHREKKAEYVWTQEVQLRDGSRIWIKRQTRFGHFGEVVQIDRAKPFADAIEFTNPQSGAVIAWQGQDGLEPLLLDFQEKVPYLATRIGRGGYFRWGCPLHPYVFFKFEGGRWERIDIKRFPEKFVDANVLPYLSEQTRRAVELHGDSMRADAAQDVMRGWPMDARSIDRRIVNPQYLCQGSAMVVDKDGKQQMITLDNYYGIGTFDRLQKRFGTNNPQKYLSEQEAIDLGILNSGKEK